MKWLFVIMTAAAFGSGARAEPAQFAVRDSGGQTHYTGLLPRAKNAPRTFYQPVLTATALDESYDSRSTGCIPSIRDQGQCGSCWAFATTGAFETALCLSGNKPLTNLAEQDPLVNDRSAYGCDGGFMDGTFITGQGETTEALCPYRANDRYSCNGGKFAHATKWALLGANGRAPTEDEVRAGIYQYGSLFVTVAAGSGFTPRGGRITTCSSSSVNHMVQLIAWRPNPSRGLFAAKYEFLIKNSWGTSWGDAGFAWSTLGCNKLASTPGDAAGFFYVESDDDPDDPVPLPATVDGLAEEYVGLKGSKIVVSVLPQAGYVYSWLSGGATFTGDHVTVQTTTSTTVALRVTDAEGAVTERTSKITVH